MAMVHQNLSCPPTCLLGRTHFRARLKKNNNIHPSIQSKSRGNAYLIKGSSTTSSPKTVWIKTFMRHSQRSKNLAHRTEAQGGKVPRYYGMEGSDRGDLTVEAARNRSNSLPGLEGKETLNFGIRLQDIYPASCDRPCRETQLLQLDLLLDAIMPTSLLSQPNSTRMEASRLTAMYCPSFAI